MKPPQYGTEATRCEEVLGRTFSVASWGRCEKSGHLSWDNFFGGMAMFLVRMMMEDSFWEGGKENTFSCCMVFMVFEGKQ